MAAVCPCNELGRWPLLLSWHRSFRAIVLHSKTSHPNSTGDALLKLVVLNYSAEVIDNGAQCICRACYNVAIFEDIRASLQDKKLQKQAPFTFRD